MFHLLGRLAATHPWKICGAWLIGAILLSIVSPSWDSKTLDDDIRFLPASCPSVRGYQLLQEAFPQDVFACRAIFAIERSEGPLTANDLALVDRLVEGLNQLRQEQPHLQLGTVYSHRDPLVGSRLTSADRQCTLIHVSLPTPYLAAQTRTSVDAAETRVRSIMAEAGPDAPAYYTTGAAGIGRDLVKSGGEGLDRTTLATVALVIVVLLLIYRAPLLALVPLVTIAVSVWVALSGLALITLLPGVHLVNVSRVFAIVILYGAGTDYCLFLISRYREELEQGYDCPTAVARSVRSVGGALTASAGTVICGLGLMIFAEFAKVRCAGPAIAVGLAAALLASLTLAPALLRILGPWVFWPRGLPGLRPTTSAGLWERISRKVVARPFLVWMTALMILLPLGLAGFCVKTIYKPTAELTPASGSVRGLDTIQRHFTAGETGPITVLLVSSTDWDAPEGRELVTHLSRGFAHLENVAEVRSLTQPLGKPLPKLPPAGPGQGLLGGLLRSLKGSGGGNLLDEANRTTRQHYIADLSSAHGPRFVTRLDVVLKSEPFDPASTTSLDLIELWLAEELPKHSIASQPVQAECFGVTVQSRDMARVIEKDRIRVNYLVVAGIFLILVVLVRRPWLAAYLLITVLISYYATLAVTAMLGPVLFGRPAWEVDWRVPFFLFTILAAVGEDYNILLVSRVLKERRRHGTDEGTRRGLAHTGGAITACGVIMAGTFATLMLSGPGTLAQIGFALAFGVLLDTFVVRPFLVPAFMLVVWRYWGDERKPALRLPALLMRALTQLKH